MGKTIDGHTSLIGLLGSPVGHSISPLIHNLAFEMLDLNYVYLAFDTAEGEMEKTIEALKRLGARGWNCTMPDKKKMYELSDHLSPEAELIGAVNTVVNDAGILTGYNTDGIGYMRAIKEAGFDIIGKKMTLLGAGGAASAILAQAALDGVAEISLFCRQGRSYLGIQKMAALLNERTNCNVTLFHLEEETILRREIADSVILTNATSAGMAPNIGQCAISDASFLHKELLVSDVIYNPMETKLLSMARGAGCTCLNGLYMLLYQGAEAFRLWTGRDMPIEAVKEKYFYS